MTFNASRWNTLSKGEEVEILANHSSKLHGLIDDFTDDRSVVWVHLSGGRGRRMFHQDDGWEVRVLCSAPWKRILSSR